MSRLIHERTMSDLSVILITGVSQGRLFLDTNIM
jgi:hypothetical protein